MKLRREQTAGDWRVRGYRDDEIELVRLSPDGAPEHRTIQGATLVSATQLEGAWTAPPFEQLTVADLAPIIALEPEVVLLVSGPVSRPPHPALSAALAARGIGCEAMETGAACRTFNALAAEGRRVVLALPGQSA